MYSNPSLVTRIAVGKAVGFAIGLIGLLSLPYFTQEGGWLLRIGVLLWYTTLGAIIGLFGIYTRHPVLPLPLPWWLRSSMLGAWMNFVLVFFAYDTMESALISFFGSQSWLTSPFWFALEGAVIGLIIGFVSTWVGGEGPETLEADTKSW